MVMRNAIRRLRARNAGMNKVDSGLAFVSLGAENPAEGTTSRRDGSAASNGSPHSSNSPVPASYP